MRSRTPWGSRVTSIPSAHRAAVGSEQRGDRPHERRLAGAVWSEQADDLAGAGAERHASERPRRTEGLGERVDLDHPTKPYDCMVNVVHVPKQVDHDERRRRDHQGALPVRPGTGRGGEHPQRHNGGRRAGAAGAVLLRHQDGAVRAPSRCSGRIVGRAWRSSRRPARRVAKSVDPSGARRVLADRRRHPTEPRALLPLLRRLVTESAGYETQLVAAQQFIVDSRD